MTKQRIINNPEQWIITRHGDFVRIKDNLVSAEKKLALIREHLKSPYQGVVRFQEKSLEQIAKERYDKVLEEVNFDYEKLHNWIYDEKNKDKIEVVKQNDLSEQDFWAAVSAIFSHVLVNAHFENGILGKSWNTKWRVKNSDGQKILVNEETGQIIYDGKGGHIIGSSLLAGKENVDSYNILRSTEKRPKKKHTSAVIFLHGTYGAIGAFEQLEKKFPSTKFIYPNSPILQYDMWHGSNPAPGGQCRGWINVTGDVYEIMDNDVCSEAPPPKKNFAEADKIVHLDYPQLMRAVHYVNEIIEQEISNGVSPEKIIVAGYSQGALLTLAVSLSSHHRLGGFVSLCGLLPRWDKLLVATKDKNKHTPHLIINNSGDSWVPFWLGKKTYEILKDRDYNGEFKTRSGLGHTWENKDVVSFLEKCFNEKTEQIPSETRKINRVIQAITALALIGTVVIIWMSRVTFRKKGKLKIRNKN